MIKLQNFFASEFSARRPTDRAKSLKFFSRKVLNNFVEVELNRQSFDSESFLNVFASCHVAGQEKCAIMTRHGEVNLDYSSEFFFANLFFFLAEKLVVLRPLVMLTRIMLNIFTRHT